MNWSLPRPARLLRTGAVACALAAAPAARGDQIDRVLVNESGAVAEKVAGLKAKHLAVLPFRVRVGTQPATFKQGTAGQQLATKLQNLLVLTNPTGKAGEYIVLGDAARAAAEAGKRTGKPIDWTTPAGRQALLDLELPVVWDEDARHTPDAFLTGVLSVSADLKTATVEVQAFSRDNPEPTTLAVLTDRAAGGIRVDRNTLADLGKSFAVPDAVLAAKHPAGAAGRARSVAGPDEAASDSAGQTPAPPPGGAISRPYCPVALTVRYNGTPAAAVADAAGNLRLVQTPPPGARIDFQLTNTGDKPVAVVLAVDGKNLIQLNPDERADRNNNREGWRKFILEPKSKVPVYKVDGWLKDTGGKIEAVTVDAEESSAVRFAGMSPATAGRIELLVFPPNDGVLPAITSEVAKGGGPAATPEADAVAQQDQATDASAIEHVDKNIGRAGSAAKARSLVLSRLADYTVAATDTGAVRVVPPAPRPAGKPRGLAADGGGPEFRGDRVEQRGFVHTALPSASLVVTYYTPEMVGAPVPTSRNDD